MDNLLTLWASSGLAQLQLGQLVMMVVGLILLFLAISKGFEPLLLVPIGFGTIMANIPVPVLMRPPFMMRWVIWKAQAAYCITSIMRALKPVSSPYFFLWA